MTPNDLVFFRSGPFMRAMLSQYMVEWMRTKGLPEAEDVTLTATDLLAWDWMQTNGLVQDTLLVGDQDPVPFVRSTPPFSSPCPGTLTDVRRARCVPCPRYDALLKEVAGVLFAFGHAFHRTFFAWLEPRDHAAGRLIRALDYHEDALREELLERGPTLDRLLPPTRKRRLWKALETLRDMVNDLQWSLDRNPMDRPIPGGRRKFQAWQQELCWELYGAFQRFGPALTDFSETAIDTAIAAMLITLQLESGTVLQVAARVRKRINKRWTDERLVPDPDRKH